MTMIIVMEWSGVGIGRAATSTRSPIMFCHIQLLMTVQKALQRSAAQIRSRRSGRRRFSGYLGTINELYSFQ